ncbi:MAG: hypothetical protein GY792_05085, partial [Gammaproteobacteria bacterium]|nr:hypothetical protein [Gammaproteobacteria bacterium]
MNLPETSLSSETASARNWSGDHKGLWELACYLILVAIYLVPVWAFTYFPSLDGPVHLSIANALVEFSQPDSAIFQEYYELNPFPVPNWSISGILYLLIHFTDPLTAEKIFLSLYTILAPLSLRYALVAITRRSAYLYLFTFPLLFHYPLHLGFYNYSIGIFLMPLIFGYWVRHRDDRGNKVFLTYFALSVFGYFTHLIVLATSLIAIGATTLGRLLGDIHSRRWQSTAISPLALLRDHLKAWMLRPLIAFMPSILAGIWALSLNRPLRSHLAAGEIEPIQRFTQLIKGSFLVSHDIAELVVSSSVILILFIVAGIIFFRQGKHVKATYEFSSVFLCFLLLSLSFS